MTGNWYQYIWHNNIIHNIFLTYSYPYLLKNQVIFLLYNLHTKYHSGGLTKYLSRQQSSITSLDPIHFLQWSKFLSPCSLFTTKRFALNEMFHEMLQNLLYFYV